MGLSKRRRLRHVREIAHQTPRSGTGLTIFPPRLVRYVNQSVPLCNVWITHTHTSTTVFYLSMVCNTSYLIPLSRVSISQVQFRWVICKQGRKYSRPLDHQMTTTLSIKNRLLMHDISLFEIHGVIDTFNRKRYRFEPPSQTNEKKLSHLKRHRFLLKVSITMWILNNAMSCTSREGGT